MWNDWHTWNLAALSPITRFYRKSFATTDRIYDPVDTGAAWAQDDWRVTKRLTLNLGVRYDGSLGSIGDRADALPPWRPANLILQRVVPTAFNDGRPNFIVDPYNGQIPTYDSIIASGARRDLAQQMIDPATYHTPYSYQTSIGFERQVGLTRSVQADYAFTRSYGEEYVRNANFRYNPATGVNYPFSDFSHLPYPDWGLAPMYFGDGWSTYHGLQTAFTKRFSRRWQASASYTLWGLWDAVGSPAVGFKVAPDLGGKYPLAVTDQRHRGRLRPNGTVVPRNNFVGQPIHRVDIRLQRRFPIHGPVAIDAILEVFNLFNHANYGSYTTTEVSTTTYARPNQNTNLTYQPRMAQVAFRVTF